MESQGLLSGLGDVQCTRYPGVQRYDIHPVGCGDEMVCCSRYVEMGYVGVVWKGAVRGQGVFRGGRVPFGSDGASRAWSM